MNSIAKGLFLVIFLTLFSQTEAKKIVGFIVKHDGEITKTNFIIPMNIVRGEPDFLKIMKGIKYSDGEEEKELKPGMCKKIGFVFNHEKIVLVSKPNRYFRYKVDSIFLRQQVEGPVSVYIYYYRQSITQVNPSGGTFSTSKLADDYILEKEGGDYLKISYGSANRVDLISFFSDYKELSEKIRRKEYDPRDIDDIVNEYNEWAAKNSDSDNE